MQTSSNFSATRSTVSPLTDQLSATLTARNPGLLDDTSVPAGDVTGRGIKMLNCIQKDYSSAAAPGTERKMTVKTLFDHGFDVRNKLVIYDDDPRIEAVMAQALTRHQKQIIEEAEFLKEANSHVLNAKTELERASELKKRQKEKQQSEMRKILDQQLTHKNKVRLEDQGQRRENYATHFGPEPEDEEIKRNREKHIGKVYKDSILKQIKRQDALAKRDKDVVIAFENLVVDAGNQSLREEERRKAEKSKDQKEYYREIWQHQMRVNADKKSIVAAAGER